MVQPIFSIVIPTRNRHDTLGEILDIVLSMPDKDFEVIIQDCSETDDGFCEIKNKFNDPRLKCHKSPSGITMTENWNLAILNCSGKYVTFIGDDDLVGLDIMKVVRWANENDLDAVCEGMPPTSYWWPNYPNPSREKTLEIPKCSGAIEYSDGVTEAIRASYSIGEKSARLPKIYRGIVKLSSLKKSYEISGKYFDGVAPDCYSVFSLPLNLKKYCIIHYSFFIAGSCRKSNSGRSTNGRTPIDHWLEYGLHDWPQFIPLVKIDQTLMAEGMVKAFTNHKRFDLVKNIDIGKLYLVCLFYDPKNALKILSRLRLASKILERSTIVSVFRVFYSLCIKAFPNLIRVLKKKFFKSALPRGAIRIHNVLTIKEALAMHQKYFPSIEKLLNGTGL